MSKQQPLFIPAPVAAEAARTYSLGDARLTEALALLERRPELIDRLFLMAADRAPEVVDSDTAAYAHFLPLLGGLDVEKFAVLALDTRHQILACEVLTVGSDRFTVVDTRQALRWALKHGARAIIMAHNHPSGDTTPSSQDRDVTARVAAGCRAVDIALLDHMILAANTYRSFAAEGDLPVRAFDGAF